MQAKRHLGIRGVLSRGVVVVALLSTPAGPAANAATVRAELAPKPLAHAKGFAAGVRQVLVYFVKGHCDPDFTADDNAYALGAREMLIRLGCKRDPAGHTYVLFRAPVGRPDIAHQIALDFPAPAAATRKEPDAVYRGQLTWESKTATLTLVESGCGDRTRWVFDGRDFQPADFEAHACNGAD